MLDIDAEAAGILIESGVDVPTALAGSVIEEPRPARPRRPLNRQLVWIAVIAGIAAALVLRPSCRRVSQINVRLRYAKMAAIHSPQRSPSSPRARPIVYVLLSVLGDLCGQPVLRKVSVPARQRLRRTASSNYVKLQRFIRHRGHRAHRELGRLYASPLSVLSDLCGQPVLRKVSVPARQRLRGTASSNANGSGPCFLPQCVRQGFGPAPSCRRVSQINVRVRYVKW